MNLNDNPTEDQLRDLLRPGDDRAGHHVLWVATDGDVRITPTAPGTTPDRFRQDHPDARVQFDAFEPGHGYVGPAGAEDRFWVEDLLVALLDEWAKAKTAHGGVLVGQI